MSMKGCSKSNLAMTNKQKTIIFRYSTKKAEKRRVKEKASHEKIGSKRGANEPSTSSIVELKLGSIRALFLKLELVYNLLINLYKL
ncbi:hypothetical protein Hanom_Chr04g00326841 [Helianthus anomalus]